VKEHHSLGFALLASLLTAVSAVIIRWTAAPITTMLFFRFLICSFSVVSFVWLRKVHLTPQSIRKHTPRAVLGLISMGCYFYSVDHLSLMNAVTLSNTAPLFLPIVIFFWLKKIVPTTRFLALLIGFLGIVVILRPSPDMQLSAALIGLLGGLCIALVQIGIRLLQKTESTRTILTHYFLISVVVSFFPMVYFWEGIENPETWFFLILLGVVSLGFQYCFTQSLKAAGSTKVSAVNYLGVPFGGLLGWWLFNEKPTLWVLIGTVLIILGGIIAILSQKEARLRE
jgi:drug/metabolite transporter (DMT)-like permease